MMHAAVQHVEALYGPGTTGTAHTPNEDIVIDELTRTAQVLVQVALTPLS